MHRHHVLLRRVQEPDVHVGPARLQDEVGPERGHVDQGVPFDIRFARNDTTLPGYPGETTCESGYDIIGKCELGSCPGVDEVDGVRNIWKEVKGNRMVFDNS